MIYGYIRVSTNKQTVENQPARSVELTYRGRA
jgi:DNA invertase Pin-like site-specific DNA recombinase